MIDPHLNLFWHYGLNDEPVDHEDNVTRALVVTLRALGQEATGRVLRRLMPVVELPPGAWECHLQRGSAAPAAGERGHLLGIAPDKVGWTDGRTRPSITGERRLDALLRLPGRALIGVESKITGPLDPPQMAGHLAHLGYDLGPEAVEAGEAPITRVDWGDVESAIGEAAAGHPIADAFIEYLEILGLGRFTGFTEADAWAWSNWETEPRALPYLRRRLEALGAALAAEPGFRRALTDGLEPLRDQGRSHKAGAESSLRWRLAGEYLAGERRMKRPRNDPMTLNVFVDPAIERGAGRGSRHPVVNVSVFMGRSFEIAEKLLDESEAFTLLKEIEMPLVPMGVELVMDAWRRPTAAARWNNTSVDPGRRRTWTVRELCASPVTLSRAVRDLVPGTVLRNQREYQPSFSFWFGLEFGEVRGGDRGPGDVVGEVARVAAEAAGVMRVIDRWRRRSKG